MVSWPETTELESFELAADLADVGINAWTDVPEIKGINGLLRLNQAGGEIHLTSHDFLMHYPTLFDHAWSYNDAKGVIGWRFEDQGVVVASQLLNLANSDLSAAGRFSLYLPLTQMSSLYSICRSVYKVRMVYKPNITYHQKRWGLKPING